MLGSNSMENDRKNYYDILEIATGATQDEINKAYQRSKNAYSGDSIALYSLMTKDECDEMLSQIDEAYSVLSIPEKRREYDRVRGIKRESAGQSFHTQTNKSPSHPGNENKLQQSLVNQLGKASTSGQSDFTYHDKNEYDKKREEYRESSQFLKFGDNSTKGDLNVSKVSAFKKFSLDYATDASFEQEIEATTEFNGALLRKIREYKNVSIERMAEMTKISKTYIKNIEDEDFEKLPAQVYTRGFVFQIAKCLKLNPELVATSYLHHLKRSIDGRRV
jgi:curved DNA-binding protein CbpA